MSKSCFLLLQSDRHSQLPLGLVPFQICKRLVTTLTSFIVANAVSSQARRLLTGVLSLPERTLTS